MIHIKAYPPCILYQSPYRSAQISDMDKKYLKDLKHQWNELFIETVKVKTQYELLIQDVKLMKEITLAINKGDTWKYKLARWLVR